MYIIASHQSKQSYILASCNFPTECYIFIAKKLFITVDNKTFLKHVSDLSIGESLCVSGEHKHYGLVKITKVPAINEYTVQQIKLSDI